MPNGYGNLMGAQKEETGHSFAPQGLKDVAGNGGIEQEKASEFLNSYGGTGDGKGTKTRFSVLWDNRGMEGGKSSGQGWQGGIQKKIPQDKEMVVPQGQGQQKWQSIRWGSLEGMMTDFGWVGLDFSRALEPRVLEKCDRT